MFAKNFLPYDYTIWLKGFAKTYPEHHVTQRLIQTLIKELKHIESIDQMKTRLVQSIETLQNSTAYPVHFLAQLGKWNKDIIGRTERLGIAKQVLDTLPSHAKTKPLISFLKKLLNSPHASLHLSANSLLSVLNNAKLPELIDYLAALEDKPDPKNPRPGSFAAIKQSLPDSDLTSDYAQCLTLLNNLTTVYKESDPICDLGNSLLQSSLIIYKDLNSMEEISLDDESSEESSHSERKISTCVLI